MKKVIDWVTIKFLIVGVINTLVGSAVMFLLYNGFHTGYWIASACNYIIGSIVSVRIMMRFTKKAYNFQSILTICFIPILNILYISTKKQAMSLV